MNRETLSIVLIFILSIILTSGCINNNQSHSENNENDITIKSYVNITYRLSFMPINNESYIIIIPCPMYNNSPEILIINKLKQEKVNYEIVETNFGQAMNITSKEKVQISFNFEEERDSYDYHLSLQNGTTISKVGCFHFYSTIEGNIEYHFSALDDYEEIRYEITGQLNLGWQELNGEVWNYKS